MGFLLEACPDLVGISLAGWKEFTGDQLASMVEDFKSLERIDLSSVNVSFKQPDDASIMISACMVC